MLIRQICTKIIHIIQILEKYCWIFEKNKYLSKLILLHTKSFFDPITSIFFRKLIKKRKNQIISSKMQEIYWLDEAFTKFVQKYFLKIKCIGYR